MDDEEELVSREVITVCNTEDKGLDLEEMEDEEE